MRNYEEHYADFSLPERIGYFSVLDKLLSKKRLFYRNVRLMPKNTRRSNALMRIYSVSARVELVCNTSGGYGSF
jgi:hypothetical protein